MMPAITDRITANGRAVQKFKWNGNQTISGEVKRNEAIDRESYFRVGRRYGRFQRCFPLPKHLVQKDGIKATFEDGILTVTAPMRESIKEKEKPIEIAVE